MLDFVLAISHVGPPAITLAAMADMSGMDQEEQGVIATVLLASYVVTPLISLSVSVIMTAIVGDLCSQLGCREKLELTEIASLLSG